jgi:hypothetical protein
VGSGSPSAANKTNNHFINLKNNKLNIKQREVPTCYRNSEATIQKVLHSSSAESDANNVAASISDYFAIPEHTALETQSTAGSSYMGFILTNKGGQNSVAVTGNADGSIRIVVSSAANRCPSDYRAASNASSGQDIWNTAVGTHLYTKIMD